MPYLTLLTFLTYWCSWVRGCGAPHWHWHLQRWDVNREKTEPRLLCCSPSFIIQTGLSAREHHSRRCTVEWCGARWSTQTRAQVSRESDVRTQGHCVLKLLLKLQLQTAPRFSSLTRQAGTEKVSFQPPVQEWQAWLNNAMKFCSQSDTFSDSRFIFGGACNPSPSFHRFPLYMTPLVVSLFWLPTQTQVLHVLYPTCHRLSSSRTWRWLLHF